MSIETMTKLATYTAGSGADSSVTFSNIPQTYTDLVVKLSVRTTRSGTDVDDEVRLEFNGSGGTAYSGRMIEGNGTTSRSATDSSYAFVTRVTAPTDNTTTSTFSNSEVYIPNYTSSNYKSISIDATMENNATTSLTSLSANLWSNTSAITSIKCTPIGTFDQYSTITIYGIRSMRNYATPKATGGIVSFDGTYWTHTFLSSGIFTPNQTLSKVDYLVVAGGGSGTYRQDRSGGGGGAGGLRSTVTATGGGGSLESPILLSATPYAITVGAGGVKPLNSSQYGNAGTGSSIIGKSINITSIGGGYGGYGNGGDGGSGGGGSGNGEAPGSGTAGQGYNGAYGSSPYGGGGGGAGSAASGTTGGSGVAVAISGTSTYYAGGGGGGTNSGTTSGGIGGGGAGGTGNAGIGGTDGTANTGGGGGGKGFTTAQGYGGGSGGSGIIILRYKA
jgi:hypothetical protein